MIILWWLRYYLKWRLMTTFPLTLSLLSSSAFLLDSFVVVWEPTLYIIHYTFFPCIMFIWWWWWCSWCCCDDNDDYLTMMFMILLWWSPCVWERPPVCSWRLQARRKFQIIGSTFIANINCHQFQNWLNEVLDITYDVGSTLPLQWYELPCELI